MTDRGDIVRRFCSAMPLVSPLPSWSTSEPYPATNSHRRAREAGTYRWPSSPARSGPCLGLTVALRARARYRLAPIGSDTWTPP